MMKYFGLTTKDYDAENTVEVIPENWPTVCFFEALGYGNWNMGFSGPTGLRYEAFKEVRLVQGIKDEDWPAMFDSLRIMEQAALDEIYEGVD